MAEETVIISSNVPPPTRRFEDVQDIGTQSADAVGPWLSRVQEGMRALMEAQRVCLLESQVHWKGLEDRRIALEAAFVELQQEAEACASISIANGERNGADIDMNSPLKPVDLELPELEKPVTEPVPEDVTPSRASDAMSPASPDTASATTSTPQRTPNGSRKRLSAWRFNSHKKSALDAAIYKAASIEREETMEPPGAKELPRWQRVLTSHQFDLWVGVLIVLNCVVMSLQLEYNGQLINPMCGGLCEDRQWVFAETSFAILEQIFTALFAIELCLRLAASGLIYLKSVMNFMDAVIVIVSSIDSWVLTPLGNEGMSNVAILRLVRLVRLSKVLRVVRVMKAFKSLRVLVSAVVASVGALAWSMTLLFVLELSGAIFLAQILRPYMEDPSRDIKSREFLWMRFGTWVRSMLSVFEITMAPGGFINYRILSDTVHPGFGAFFIFYVCIVTFAVVRVITALFLKTTLSASDQDEKRLNDDRARQQEAYARDLQSFIAGSFASHQHHSENAWRMDKNDLEAIMDTPQMHEWLRDVDLPPSDADRLFNALDPGDGMVAFSDFVTALSRMRGPVRAADQVVVRAETQKILKYLTELLRDMKKIEDYSPHSGPDSLLRRQISKTSEEIRHSNRNVKCSI